MFWVVLFPSFEAVICNSHSGSREKCQPPQPRKQEQTKLTAPSQLTLFLCINRLTHSLRSTDFPFGQSLFKLHCHQCRAIKDGNQSELWLAMGVSHKAEPSTRQWISRQHLSVGCILLMTLPCDCQCNSVYTTSWFFLSKVTLAQGINVTASMLAPVRVIQSTKHACNKILLPHLPRDCTSSSTMPSL